MSKQFYKEELGKMIAENSELKKLNGELMVQNLNLTVQKKQLTIMSDELVTQISELKEKLIDHSCHAETDGYEVGSPSDYEEDRQLKLFNEI